MRRALLLPLFALALVACASDDCTEPALTCGSDEARSTVPCASSEGECRRVVAACSAAVIYCRPCPEAGCEVAASGCDAVCARAVACGQPDRTACLESCEAADPAVSACLEGCVAAADCEGYFACATACATPADPGRAPYGACGEGRPANAPACLASEPICLKGRTEAGLGFSVCTPRCDAAGACRSPETGDATPFCNTDLDPALCYLSCADGRTCPDGMQCAAGGDPPTCVFIDE